MKRSFSFFVFAFLALSLFLAFSAMAQTQPQLFIESLSGDRIGGAPITTFSLSQNGSLIVYLNGPFSFKSIVPDIVLGANPSCPSPTCTIAVPASVSAVQGTNIYFNVTSPTATSITMKVSPDEGPVAASFSGSTFNWNTAAQGSTPAVGPGSYLSVFEATDGTNISQSVVMITLTPPITVTAPTSVTGPSTGSVNTACSFTASGSTSTQAGDTVQYQFDWGDGSQSSWGSGTQSKTWGAPGGPYTVKAMARSGQYTTVQSGWTTGPAVTISTAPPPATYTLTVNVSPTGGGTVTVGGTAYSSPVTGLSGSQLLYIMATPNTGSNYQFSSWTVGIGGATIGSSGSASTTVTMNNANAVITANFSSTISTACAQAGDSCAQQLGSAVSLNFPICDDADKGMFGYESRTISHCTSAEVTIPTGGTSWFLVDASQVRYSGTSLRISIADYAQGNTGGKMKASIYPIDSNGNLISVVIGKSRTTIINPSGDNYQYSSVSLPANYKYLVKVEEPGAGVPISVYFNP